MSWQGETIVLRVRTCLYENPPPNDHSGKGHCVSSVYWMICRDGCAQDARDNPCSRWISGKVI
ncbi:hypothetical protein FIBSPDRAFT_857575, partial [Athelia psychrophila]